MSGQEHGQIAAMAIALAVAAETLDVQPRHPAFEPSADLVRLVEPGVLVALSAATLAQPSS